jgi:predicted ATP-grasp superfamily ATP-dependent carboligase
MSQSQMAGPLPAVVVGIETPIGLTVIRDLGSRGVPVIGIGRSSTALGMASRHLQRGLVRAPTPPGLIDQLAALGQELGRACLFAISENDIELLNRHRDRLGNFQIMFADARRMASVLNKDATYAAAARAGVRAPRTEQVADMAELEALVPGLRFPVVVKWANPHEAMAALGPFGLGIDKTRYCHSGAELIDYLRPYARAGVFPLIQEYCAGYGLGQFVLMKDGVAHYTFQHRRVHEWPPEGGFSSLCESVAAPAHPDLMAKSIALLRELEWEGVAMVEYRYDPATDEAALMEVNGRFWGSLPLAYHAGASFPYLLYRLFGLGEQIAPMPYRAGVRCRYMLPETKRLLRILFAQHKIPDRKLRFARGAELGSYLFDFVRPGSRYYVFDTRDLGPFFSDLKQMAGKALAPVLPRRRARDAVQRDQDVRKSH